MSGRIRVGALSVLVVILGASALHADAPSATHRAAMCEITCGPDDHPGCTLCRGECSDANHTVGCYYACGGEQCPVE
jgi:hypothetical protein